ncbi:hypothetical protein PJP07_30640, partial [Mycobacterium kansasii]
MLLLMQQQQQMMATMMRAMAHNMSIQQQEQPGLAAPVAHTSNLFERFQRFRPSTSVSTHRAEEVEYWLN